METSIKLSDSEYEKYSKVTDNDINELLQEVRRDITTKILIHGKNFTKKELFRKDLPITIYIVYYDLGNSEVEVVNFPGNTNGFTTYMTKPSLINYLHGIITGYKYALQKEQSQHKYTDRQNDN